MAACFCNRLVLCFDGDKTINGGVGMEVVKITKKVYKAIGCEEGHFFGTFAHFKELRESSNLSVQKTCFCCGHKFQPEDFIFFSVFWQRHGKQISLPKVQGYSIKRFRW